MKYSGCTRRGQAWEWEALPQNEQEVLVALMDAQKLFNYHKQKVDELMARIIRLQKHEQFLRGHRCRIFSQEAGNGFYNDIPHSYAEFLRLNEVAEQHGARQPATTSKDTNLASIMDDPFSFCVVPNASCLQNGSPGPSPPSC